MTRIFLLRHAQSTANEKGILAGRAPGVTLSKNGLVERNKLTERFAGTKFDVVISSPIQRCLETIKLFEPKPTIIEDFQEVNYGDWTGKKMSSLMRNKEWRKIYSNPTGVRFPNGETLPEVQIRSLNGVERHIRKKDKNVLIVTHADVIKVLVLHALGSHLNNIDKIHVSNASTTILDFKDNDYRVIKVNDESSRPSDFLIKK